MPLRLIRAVSILLSVIPCCFGITAQSAPKPIRVAIVGLVHGHVQGFLGALPQHPDEATLVAIVEPDTALAAKYEGRYHLAHSLFYTDLEQMLTAQKPDAVLVYTTILDHRRVIEAAAKHGISSMVEKPLSTTMEDALAIRRTAREHHVHVLVNYETTWYASNAEAIKAAHDGELGTIRKVVVHDGHEGPKEIGVGPEWLPWLTDPVQDGAGALFDFGCYGADLMTVITRGETPVSVTAVAQTDKPEIYPKVDDDATVIVRYPGAQAVLMPSWDWSFARKDMEIYGTGGYMDTVAVNDMGTPGGPAGSPPQRYEDSIAGTHVRVRLKGQARPTYHASPALPPDQRDSLSYLAAVLHGKIEDKGDLSALDTNMIVMQILDAARTSAKTGRTVALTKLPE